MTSHKGAICVATYFQNCQLLYLIILHGIGLEAILPQQLLLYGTHVGLSQVHMNYILTQQVAVFKAFSKPDQ